jgi:hypothetical protein
MKYQYLMHKLLYHVYYIHLKKNIVIELIFPYSIAEGGGNCVPMYSNNVWKLENF